MSMHTLNTINVLQIYFILFYFIYFTKNGHNASHTQILISWKCMLCIKLHFRQIMKCPYCSKHEPFIITNIHPFMLPCKDRYCHNMNYFQHKTVENSIFNIKQLKIIFSIASLSYISFVRFWNNSFQSLKCILISYLLHTCLNHLTAYSTIFTKNIV